MNWSDNVSLEDLNFEDVVSGDAMRDEKIEIILCEYCVKNGIKDSEESHNVCDDDVCYDCWSEVYQ